MQGIGNLVPRPSTPKFYLAAVEKNGCEMKSGRGRPGYKVRYCNGYKSMLRLI